VIRASTALSPLTDRAVDFDCAQSTTDCAVSAAEPHHSISLGSFLTRNRLSNTPIILRTIVAFIIEIYIDLDKVLIFINH
jgi:hypothetical protein